jgi:hypothetical protein
MHTLNVSSNGTNVLTPNLTREYPLKNFVVDYVRTITPTLVNDSVWRSVFPRERSGLYQRDQRGICPRSLGFLEFRSLFFPQ